MKTIIIFLLVLIVAAGSFLSRPTQEDFNKFILAKNAETSSESDLLKPILDSVKTKLFLEGCTYKNRIFWAEIEKDGRVIYIGVFSHWFSRGGAMEPAKPTAGNADLSHAAGNM